MRIGVGSDHAGCGLKEILKEYLIEKSYHIDDFGVFSSDQSSDYPEQAMSVARALVQNKIDRGILVCGSGLGMSIAANRISGIRAILAPSVEYAYLGRRHNKANILCLGERLISRAQAVKILDEFLKVRFAGGRHNKRIEKIEGTC